MNFKIYLQSSDKAMVEKEGRTKIQKLNISRTKRAFQMK